MAGVLGRAFVQVFADLSKFTPGLRQEIKKALDEQTKGLKFEELDKSAKKAGEGAADELAKGVDSKIEKNMEKEGKKGGASFGKGLKGALSGVAGLFMPVMIALGVESAAALAPAIVALGATIPAAIGTAVAGAAVLKMAFSGVGATIKDAFDPKNAKQFSAEMKKLAPAAREFVGEVQGIHPAFKRIQQDVQQTFFVQFEGSLKRVAGQLLPTLRTGLHQVSGDLGQMGRGLLAGLGNGKTDIASIFTLAHAALKPLIPALYLLVSSFLTIGAAAGPLFASLSGGFGHLLSQFVAFINAEAQGGGLADFFNDALVVIKQLGSLLGNVVGLIMDIVQALGTVGGQGLGLIGKLVAELNDFFASAQGQDALASVFNLMNVALNSIFQILTPLLPALAQLVQVFSGGLATALEKVTPYLTAVADWLAKHPQLLQAAVAAWGIYRAALIAVSVAEGIMDALDPLTWIVLAVAAIAAGAYLIYKNWGAVTRALSAAWDAIKSFFTGIWNWITGIGHDIANWFTVTLPNFFVSLPGKILNALNGLGLMLGQLFINALHLAGEVIGVQVGLVLAFFIKLPGWIWDAIKGIGHLFVDLWHLVFNTGKTILTAEINGIIWVFTQLPGKIGGFLSRLPGIIGGAFRLAWDWAKREVFNGAEAVIGFVQKLPGRISGFMRNVGHDILGGLKSGINAVIGGFNSGIDKVSGAIHIGLPHLPMLASGGLINAPTLAVVGEAGPEAVVPMSDPSKAAAVAKSTGLLDMLGSVSHSESTVVRVFLGTREITDILDVRIDKKMNDQANELAYGTR